MKSTPCRQSDPALFDSTGWIDHREARRHCTTCPLVRACLNLALAIASEHDDDPSRGPDGTWAGLLWHNGHVVTLPCQRAPEMAGVA